MPCSRNDRRPEKSKQASGGGPCRPPVHRLSLAPSLCPARSRTVELNRFLVPRPSDGVRPGGRALCGFPRITSCGILKIYRLDHASNCPRSRRGEIAMADVRGAACALGRRSACWPRPGRPLSWTTRPARSWSPPRPWRPAVSSSTTSGPRETRRRATGSDRSSMPVRASSAITRADRAAAGPIERNVTVYGLGTRPRGLPASGVVHQRAVSPRFPGDARPDPWICPTPLRSRSRVLTDRTRRRLPDVVITHRTRRRCSATA